VFQEPGVASVELRLELRGISLGSPGENALVFRADFFLMLLDIAKLIVPPSAAPSRPVNLGLGDLVLIVTCLYTAVW
jgi:hypothetical protein